MFRVKTKVSSFVFFITGSLVANLDLNFSSETGNNLNNNHVTLNPATVFKTAAGYNNSTWDVSCNWLGNAIWVSD